jgi:hypothetical protein
MQFQKNECKAKENSLIRKQQDVKKYMLEDTGGNSVEIAIEVLKKYSPQSLIKELR